MSLRPRQDFAGRVSIAASRMAPGGRRWSESPIPRPARRRVRQVGQATTPLLWWWPFDETSGTVAADVSHGAGAFDLLFRWDPPTWGGGGVTGAGATLGSVPYFYVMPTEIVYDGSPAQGVLIEASLSGYGEHDYWVVYLWDVYFCIILESGDVCFTSAGPDDPGSLAPTVRNTLARVTAPGSMAIRWEFSADEDRMRITLNGTEVYEDATYTFPWGTANMVTDSAIYTGEGLHVNDVKIHGVLEWP